MIEARDWGLPAVANDCRYGPREIVEPERTRLLMRQRERPWCGVAEA